MESEVIIMATKNDPMENVNEKSFSLLKKTNIHGLLTTKYMIEKCMI